MKGGNSRSPSTWRYKAAQGKYYPVLEQYSATRFTVEAVCKHSVYAQTAAQWSFGTRRESSASLGDLLARSTQKYPSWDNTWLPIKASSKKFASRAKRIFQTSSCIPVAGCRTSTTVFNATEASRATKRSVSTTLHIRYQRNSRKLEISPTALLIRSHSFGNVPFRI